MGQEVGRRRGQECRRDFSPWEGGSEPLVEMEFGGLRGGTSILVKMCWVLRSQNIRVAGNQWHTGERRLRRSGDRHGGAPREVGDCGSYVLAWRGARREREIGVVIVQGD